MSFDKPTRNALANMVGECRRLLTDDIRHQLQAVYGLQPDGTALAVSTLGHLDERGHEIAQALREWQDHLASTEAGTEPARKKSAFERLAHETAFTVLNRLAALRMCEERGHVIECVRRGTESDGFVLYERFSGGDLGTRGETYQIFLERMFDELAVDLGSLFDLRAPQSLIFPRERCLEEVLTRLNEPKLAHLWKEDETIGWVYQYFNSKEEREKMREASAAPRNSRELAVRNQFFTPRYVVEFLVDNTLGRIWYEMRTGKTRLREECRYLVMRPDEVFLDGTAYAKNASTETPEAEKWLRAEDVSEPAVWDLASLVNGYNRSGGFGEGGNEWVEERLLRLKAGETSQMKTQELLDLLFLFCRKDRFCEGTLDSLEVEIAGILAVLRERVSQVRSPERSQEEILREPVFIPFRPNKDPRDIKILDPACGSGHFLLYCFDLLETIYEEAWASEQPVPSEVTGKKLREDYPDLDSLKRALPGLILRHNLHGIDIDLRACQIAALAFWLRAQRSYQRLGLKGSGRPKITKSNIVCAEPMPGEKQLLKQFLTDLQPKVIGQLVERVFEKMTLAGEAGSLLKIEEELGDAIGKAKKQWLEQPKREQMSLFPRPKQQKPEQQALFDLSGITDEQFWQEAEKRVLEALKDYAERVSNPQGLVRRLFADDAARGFAFIDLCRKRYDAVLMNPPYGAATNRAKELLKSCYPCAWLDVYAAFMERASGLLTTSGLYAAITSRTFLNLSKFADFRREHLITRGPVTVTAVDLGSGVLDAAAVETVAFSYARQAAPGTFLFFRADTIEDKGTFLLEELHSVSKSLSRKSTFVISPSQIKILPDCMIGYHLAEWARKIFADAPPVRQIIGPAFPGLQTDDDFRFVRLWWEVPAHLINVSWAWALLGGTFERLFRNIQTVVLWSDDGKEIKQNVLVRYGSPSKRVQNEKVYFRPGLTYIYTGSIFSVQILPCGCVPTVAAQGIYPHELTKVWTHLAYLNSGVAQFLIKAINPGRFFQSTYVESLPVCKLSDEEKIGRVVREIYEMERAYVRLDHRSTCFVGFPLRDHCCLRESFADLMNSTKQARRIAEDRWKLIDREIQNGHQIPSTECLRDVDAYSSRLGLVESDINEYAASCVEWVLGMVVGRFKVNSTCRYDALLESALLNDPFAPLPASAPGMLQNDQGFPLTEDYVRRLQAAGQWSHPLDIPWEGILLDDPGPAGTQPHRDDVVRRVRTALTVVGKDRAEAIEQEICEILGVKDLREYLRKPGLFFADHLKRYSSSRRQAPIYWPLSTASGSYTLWIYYHRLNDQTLYTALNKYVKPKVEEVEKELRRIESDLPNAMGRQGAKLRDSYEDTKAFLEELYEFRDELQRVAALPYKPNLNDGVLITASPLWKLFRLPKWRKDLEACWNELSGGEYDWAHLAYSVWPDRVRDVCKRDRSIAIAHGLEGLCEVQVKPTKKKRTKREKVDAPSLGEDA